MKSHLLGYTKYPNDILDTRLFLTCFNVACEWKVINNSRISHIVNATQECYNLYEKEGIKYLKLDILDEDDKKIHKYFKTAYEFINNALEEHPSHGVLVHCAQGKSRSATIVIMFLMRKMSWPYEKVQILFRG